MVLTARRAAPTTPPGHGTWAPGKAAKNLATAAIQPANGPASRARTSATGGDSALPRVARTPRTVAGGTATAATRFAGTAYSATAG